jgi:ParB family chromosome partitioning protein
VDPNWARRLSGTEVPPSEEQTAARDALKAEFERLEEEYADAEQLPEEVDRQLGEIETALEAFDQRPVLYDAAEVARAGAFVRIDSAGVLRIERGYVRPDDEPRAALPAEVDQAAGDTDVGDAQALPASGHEPGAADGPGVVEPVEDEGVRPLSDRLLTELSAHRTLALREAVGPCTIASHLRHEQAGRMWRTTSKRPGMYSTISVRGGMTRTSSASFNLALPFASSLSSAEGEG